MTRACNIDSRGRAIRAWLGLGLLLAGAVLALSWGYPLASTLGWVVAGLFVVAGVGALIEARLGWCAARAVGIRVPF
jgi:hypothetical protein